MMAAMRGVGGVKSGGFTCAESAGTKVIAATAAKADEEKLTRISPPLAIAKIAQ
jgi:hypothetical protein